MKITPTLKAGTSLYRLCNSTPISYLIGNAQTRLAITSPDVPALFSALLRGSPVSEISANLAIPEEDLDDLLEQLDNCGLLQSESSAIQVSERFISQITQRVEKVGDRSKDAALSQLRNRISPELTLTRWLPGVSDSGVSKVSARQSAHIEISGNSRAAQPLFAYLIASGVTDTQFAQNFRRGDELVKDLDLSGSYLSALDIGALFTKISAAVGKSLSLFSPIKESAEEISSAYPEKVIKVHFGDLDPTILALWMTGGQEHILISEISGARFTISQLIKPGLTPCARCLELTIGSQRECEIIDRPQLRDELPIVGSHYLAALLASQLLSIIDTGSAVISRDAIAIDLTDLCNTEHITISRHPMCGCNW